MGPADVVVGLADQFLACAHRRVCWSGHRLQGLGGGALGYTVDGDAFHSLAPLMGFAIGFGLMVAVYWIFRQMASRGDRPVFS